MRFVAAFLDRSLVHVGAVVAVFIKGFVTAALFFSLVDFLLLLLCVLGAARVAFVCPYFADDPGQALLSLSANGARLLLAWI